MVRLFAVLVLAGASVNAAVVISNFTLTTTSVNFDISGTFPSLPPSNYQSVLFFVNPDVATEPGFALGDFYESDSYSFTGWQPLRLFLPIAAGNIAFGDYFFVAFANNFEVGETINGSVAATWGRTAFNPDAVSSLNVFWGGNHELPENPSTQPSVVTGGTFLTTVGVPEPSSLSLLLAGSAVLMAGRRRKLR